jgi:hypothetical protein
MTIAHSLPQRTAALMASAAGAILVMGAGRSSVELVAAAEAGGNHRGGVRGNGHAAGGGGAGAERELLLGLPRTASGGFVKDGKLEKKLKDYDPKKADKVKLVKKIGKGENLKIDKGKGSKGVAKDGGKGGGGKGSKAGGVQPVILDTDYGPFIDDGKSISACAMTVARPLS